MRMVGLEGLRTHVRRDVAAAKHFESLVREDDRFEIVFPVTLGLVCIRLCHKDADLKVSRWWIFIIESLEFMVSKKLILG